MRYALWEIPYITRFEDLCSEATVFINTGQQEGAVVYKSPLGLNTRVSDLRQKVYSLATNRAVPVQFADSALLQVLLGTCNVMALRQVLDDLLPRPAAWEQSSLRLGETPLDIGHEAIIGTGSAELVWVLEVESFVCSTYSREL
jgi:hypothetical protein